MLRHCFLPLFGRLLSPPHSTCDEVFLLSIPAWQMAITRFSGFVLQCLVSVLVPSASEINRFYENLDFYLVVVVVLKLMSCGYEEKNPNTKQTLFWSFTSESNGKHQHSPGKVGCPLQGWHRATIFPLAALFCYITQIFLFWVVLTANFFSPVLPFCCWSVCTCCMPRLMLRFCSYHSVYMFLFFFSGWF